MSSVANVTATPAELESWLGEQIRAERLRKNITMADLAILAGVSDQTIRALETGRGARVESLIRVVIALGRTDWLTSFRPPVTISPLQIAQGKPRRQRGSHSVLTPSAAKER